MAKHPLNTRGKMITLRQSLEGLITILISAVLTFLTWPYRRYQERQFELMKQVAFQAYDAGFQMGTQQGYQVGLQHGVVYAQQWQHANAQPPDQAPKTDRWKDL